MTDAHRDWATAVRCFDLMMRDRAPHSFPDPSIATQLQSGHAFVLGAPSENFSEKTPVWLPATPQDAEYLPIDVLYGTYDPKTRVIEIYVNRIGQDAKRFGAEFEELLSIVRLHEYVHALVHLGVPAETATASLSAFSCDQKGDRRTFFDERTGRFLAVDERSHEFIAQAVTYACLSTFGGSGSERMLEIFDRLEKAQPPHYRVPQSVKDGISRVDWSLVLRAARREADVCRPDEFELSQGLVQLALEFCERESRERDREWAMPVDDSAVQTLKQSLRLHDLTAAKAGSADQPEFLVDRFSGLKVEVFAREHGKPHFRVKCGDESANYTIEDCTQLNGGLQRQYRLIREWHATNKQRLIDKWNSSRPSDCPVGAYRGR